MTCHRQCVALCCCIRTWSSDWIFQLGWSRQCKSVCWFVHLPIQPMTLAYQWLSQIVSLDGIKFTYTRYMRPRFRHRCIETLFFSSFAFYRCTPMQYCTPNQHFVHFLQLSIDVNRSDSLCNDVCIFVNVTFLLLFFNFKYHQFHICKCAVHSHRLRMLRSNGKWHFDFTFAQTPFICLTFSISLFSPSNKQPKRCVIVDLYMWFSCVYFAFSSLSLQ